MGARNEMNPDNKIVMVFLVRNDIKMGRILSLVVKPPKWADSLYALH